MSAYENVIFYELTQTNDHSLILQFRSRIPINAERTSENIINNSISSNSMELTGSPEWLLNHDYIDVSQRRFSLKVEDGHNVYAIRLSSDVDCQFGPGTKPITLFSPQFTNDVFGHCELRNQATEAISNFNDCEAPAFDGYDWLTFDIDRGAVVEKLRKARAQFESPLVKLGHIQPSEHDQFAIPFYFNLYHARSGAPFWVVNDHDNRTSHHDEHDRKGPRYHGGAHPNANAYLLFE